MTHSTSADAGSSNPRRTAWLSQGFEVLAAELGSRPGGLVPKRFDFEVVVIGSGYGGAVAAAELSASIREDKQNDDDKARPRGVCVLERGREYLRGMFPSRLAELPKHIRYNTSTEARTRGERTALWDFRAGPDMAALVANGLGGGSLINAGVMEKPDATVLAREEWPAAVRGSALETCFNEASKIVGATTTDGRPNVWKNQGEELRKVVALNTLHGKPASKVALTLAVEAKQSQGNVRLDRCVRCGDCATGCNHGAKESLDTNLLVQARAQGAHIYSGATVLQLRKVVVDGAAGWTVIVNHTDEKLRRRQTEPVPIHARRVVLAAGTFGSTEILLRSRSAGLQFSTRLGRHFSGNGDMLASLVDLDVDVKAVADERKAPKDREVGPTITGMIDERNTATRVVIQDLTIPSALRHLFEEGSAIAKAFDTLSTGDNRTQTGSEHDPDPCAIDDRASTKALIVAMMGHDSADGTIELVGDPSEWTTHAHGDGAVRICWPQARTDRRLEVRQARLAELHRKAKLGGRALPNPFWRVLPPQLEFLFGDQRGPLLTVHPLGGCAMAEDAVRGVVDDLGRVYDPARPREVHDGLVVLDGSIIPTSLGINPALTITAVALRAIRELMVKHWGLARSVPSQPDRTERPIFRHVSKEQAPNPNARATVIEVIERLSGPVYVRGYPDLLHAELTLQFEQCTFDTQLSPSAGARRLIVDPKRSKLRLFTDEKWNKVQRRPDDDPPDEEASWIAPVNGSFMILRQEPSTAAERRVRALLPWLFNRGVRDIVQEIGDRLAPHLARLKRYLSGSPELPPADPPGAKPRPRGFGRLCALLAEVGHRIKSTYALLSLAGEVRLFEYDLNVGAPTKPLPALAAVGNSSLRAVKRLTYDRKANPWNQLLDATFVQAPFAREGGGPAVLALDLRFLERRATPVFRLLAQEDQVAALVDTARFGLYLLRILLRVHTWSFRKPDVATLKVVDRFPRLEGVTAQTFDVDTSSLSHLQPLLRKSSIRLTRFPPERDEHGRPVLMIHGYSVSGTTFAHPAAPSLAQHLSRLGYDAWVVDLRTSAAMETAKLPWSFEEVAYADIPKAVDFIVQKTGFSKIDVVAHCIGSAMVCMALLEEDTAKAYRDGTSPNDPYNKPPVRPLRTELQQRIRRLVLSQVTPVTLYTPNNVFRAFVLRYVRHYLNLDDYAFRIEGKPSLSDQLLDRFLATLPYPKAEFNRENPPPWRGFKRTPWTSTRHRMDALYGRDFSLANMSDETLEYIDDLFGPLNIETVSQAIHFARFRVLTDKTGFNRYVLLDRVRQQLSMPILTLHGSENGLVDVSTLNYVLDLWRDARLAPNDDNLAEVKFDHVAHRVPGHGHQDCFIGTDAREAVFEKIASFLDRKDFTCPQDGFET